MKKNTTTTDLNLPKALENPALIFTNLDTALQYLLGILQGPLHYYETLRRGIEVFPKLNTVNRIDLLKKLLFATTQFNNLSVHNFNNIILNQLKKEERILAFENRTGKTAVVNEKNGNICTLSTPKLIVFNGTITDLGHFIGNAISTTKNKNGSLMFLSNREEIAEIATQIFVDIHGEKLNYHSILRYIKESWIYSLDPTE